MNQEINLPPFYVGQRVVALRPSENGFRVTGKIYTVLALNKCTHCGLWTIDIGDNGELACLECRCGVIDFSQTCTEWHYADAFAPIESTFQSIELSEVIKIETPLVCSN